MKLRIKGNSIRIRLTKSEIAYFQKFNSIEEKTDFGPVQLTYGIKTYNGEKMVASMENNSISFLIPSPIAEEWTTTDRVGFSSEMELKEGKLLFLLLEKDFKCLDETTEDQSDNYENPLAHLHK